VPDLRWDSEGYHRRQTVSRLPADSAIIDVTQPSTDADRFKDMNFLSSHTAFALALGFVATNQVLRAQDATFTNSGAKAALVELYTSEGCSSCPPAEAWLSTLAHDDRLWKTIFPVAFHVDYWDGLGWPDRFARAAYTQRQQEYAARLHQDSVYTPEFVADGAEYRGFFHGNPEPEIKADKKGELTLVLKDGRVTGTYAPATSNGGGGLALNTALLGLHVKSDVQRGENSGRTLEHDFVVLAFASTPLAGDGAALHSAPAPLASTTSDPARALVGWVSGPDGSIRQVAGGWIGDAR
jgi:hypothetical protein